MSYYDDFYEPSEFDMKVEEFKEELRSSVKQEFVDRIQKLEDEVQRLHDIKENWDSKVDELKKSIREYNNAKLKAETDAKKARLVELLEPHKLTAWGIGYKYDYIFEKCDKCDEKGYIHYRSPQGRLVNEECDCRRKIDVLYPTEATLYRIKQGKRGDSPVFYYQYKRHEDGYYSDYEDEWKETTCIYSGEDFDSINSYYGVVFFNHDDAVKYCEWHNEKARKKVIDDLGRIRETAK